MADWKRYAALPDGYAVTPPVRLADSTLKSRKADAWIGALDDIAAAGCWTEWGYGHTTAMITRALERRGMIEVAEPTRMTGTGHHKRPAGRLLYRATRDGIRLVNRHRKERGAELLPMPLREPASPIADIGTWELHDAIRLERDPVRLRELNAELRQRLDRVRS